MLDLEIRKIKGEGGLSAIELAQLRGFAKFLPELRARKPKRKPRFNWVGDLKPQEFARSPYRCRTPAQERGMED